MHLNYEKGQWIARQIGKQASSVMRSMVGCNALIDIPANSGTIPLGALVKAVLLGALVMPGTLSVHISNVLF